MSFRRISRRAPAAWSSLLFQHSAGKPSSHCRVLSSDPLIRRSFSSASASDSSPDVDLRAVRELRAELERERQREREARKRAGLDTKDIDAEEEEDFMGVGPLIEKLEKQALKDESRPERYFMFDDEPTDSDSEAEEEEEAMIKKMDLVEKKLERHKELLEKFADSETFDEAYSWMNKIDKFEEKHIRIRSEYRVIGELINRLKVAEGKDKFILQHKLNRAVRLVQVKEANDPNDPGNYGVIEREDEWGGGDTKLGEDSDHEKSEEDEEDEDEKLNEDGEDEYDDMKEKDNILVAKINQIDQKLEQKLEELEYAFGRKGKALEEEIKDLTEERNVLIEKKKTPLYRKGFDVRLINVNRTCKVTKGGQIVSYTAILACGNYQGVVGYAKAKAPAVPIALQKAYEKCFQNLHYVERHEEHTIAHAIQTSYKKTKVYLWPASTRTGMKAGRTVEMILHLAGFKNVKSKVVGSRNPHNTVKAVFKALNAIETPKDMQEKLGRTVVEKYLL